MSSKLIEPQSGKISGEMPTEFRSPLGRARGLGSAKEGVHHFWMQRVTAVALVPLSLWFAFSVAQLRAADFAAVQHWVSSPSVALTLVLFLITLFYHSQLGLQVVIEDYVGHKGARLAALLGSKFLHFILGAASIFAVLKIALA